MRVIGGIAKGNKLLAPNGLKTRPTADRLKESLFNMLCAYLYDINFLDLFSGSGSIGIEALSRGAQLSVFVESSPHACEIIKKNLYKTKFMDKSLLLNTDVFRALDLLHKQNKKFDIVYLDPPYSFPNINNILLNIKNNRILTTDGFIVVEHSSDYKIMLNEFAIFKEKAYKTTTFSFLKIKEGDI